MSEEEREEYLAKQAAGARYAAEYDGVWYGGLHCFWGEKERYREVKEKEKLSWHQT